MPFEEMEISHIRNVAESVAWTQLPFPVHAVHGAGLSVDWDGADAAVAAEDKCALCRGFFLLARAV